MLPDLINSDQRGFLADRTFSLNIQKVFNIITYAKKKNIPGAIVSVDYQKCLIGFHLKEFILH